MQMLEYRSQYGRVEGRREDVGSVEGQVIACFVSLTLQLSEVQLKPVFLQLLHWGTCAPEEIAAAAATAGGLGATVGGIEVSADEGRFFRFAHLCRRITLYRTLEALQDALKSIFTPYCADYLQVRCAAGALCFFAAVRAGFVDGGMLSAVWSLVAPCGVDVARQDCRQPAAGWGRVEDGGCWGGGGSLPPSSA